MSKEETVEDLKSKIHNLKKELRRVNQLYGYELSANKHLINANTRLSDDNKWLKRDLKRIPKVLKYIDICKKQEVRCNINKIKDILVGVDSYYIDE